MAEGRATKLCKSCPYTVLYLHGFMICCVFLCVLWVCKNTLLCLHMCLPLLPYEVPSNLVSGGLLRSEAEGGRGVPPQWTASALPQPMVMPCHQQPWRV